MMFSSRHSRRRLTPETLLAILASLALACWTWLVRSGWGGITDSIDAFFTSPLLNPRSYRGQVAEAISLLSHPVLVVGIIAGIAIFSFRVRMRRLALTLAIAAGSVGVLAILAQQSHRARPETLFTDSISYLGGAYPAGHVAAVTILAWTLVTLTRAHRRSTSIVARWAAVGILAVLTTTTAQWVMALIHLSDAIAGILYGVAVANIALAIGGLSPILEAWAMLGSQPAPTNRRAGVVINPSKFEDLSLFRRRVEAAARQAGWQTPLWFETTSEDSGREATIRALEAGIDRLIVAGGDGTVRAVSATLAHTEMPLALIPSGTGNLLARNLAIPLDSDAAIDLAFAGEARPIDLVQVTHDHGTERFAVMAGLGLDAEIMDSTSSDLKKVIRSGAYALAAVQHAVPKPFEVSVQIGESEPVQMETVMALMGNVGTITAGMTLFPDAQPDDGLLDLMIAKPTSVVDWTKLGAHVLTGRASGDFPTFAGASLRIETTEPVPFELDGDTAGTTRHLEACVEQGAVLVVVPS